MPTLALRDKIIICICNALQYYNTYTLVTQLLAETISRVCQKGYKMNQTYL